MTHPKQPPKTIRTTQQLLQQGLVDKSAVSALNTVAQEFSVGITDHVLQQIQQADATDPVYNQFVPKAEELNRQADELGDPIGDDRYTPVTGIVHRHPDRCLLKPVNVCPVYCRFCFRRELLGQGALSPEAMDQAIQYITEHPEIWEVILTGGDPLIMKPKQLASLIQRLSAIDHVKIIRFHTRVPVTDPGRINEAMLAALQKHCPVYLVVHANHPREFTPEAIAAFNGLIKAGVVLLSQSVLLKGINDTLETLESLMRRFVEHRIKPYYLHHGDMAKGTAHFRTSIETGQVLMRGLRQRVSGLCLPTYVLDIPGGHGKVPIGPNYLENHSDNGAYQVMDHAGCWHVYHEC